MSYQDRIRVDLQIERGKVSDLVVQLETWREAWDPVVRYNFAHGVPHKDMMYMDGRKTKEWFHGRKLEEVTNEAINDLKRNWKDYLTRCGYEKER